MTVSAPAASLVNKDYLSVVDLTPAELHQVLDLAATLKHERAAGLPRSRPLDGKHVALLFEKPSLRTRTTFLIAVHELGGHVIEAQADVVFGSRESIEDVARNLERWVSGVIVRTYGQQRLADFAAIAPRLHVVNALTNEEHPCQALADMLTFRERVGAFTGRTLAFVGDGNNVATSLAHATAMLGVHMRIASPEGFELSAEVVSRCRQLAQDGATIELMRDPYEAVRGADALYTDVWTSMGQESQSDARTHAFQPYQVNDALMAAAGPGTVFMHCLPAHRGFEVTDSVMDSAASVVFDQAENRLHTQKALLALLLAS